MIVPTFQALALVVRQMFAIQLQQQQQHYPSHNPLHYCDLSPSRTINQLLPASPAPSAVCVSHFGFNQSSLRAFNQAYTSSLQARISLVHITLEPINASRTTSCLIEEVAEPEPQPEIKAVQPAKKLSEACVKSIHLETVEKLETGDQVRDQVTG